MLIFATDLEEVEEIGRGGVDGDEVLGWFRDRSLEGGHRESRRALRID